MGFKLGSPGTTYPGYVGMTDNVTAPFVAPDASPVGVLSHNGVDDPSVIFTFTAIIPGYYRYTLPIPNTYAVGDDCGIRITWTLNSIPGGYVDSFIVTSGRDLPPVTGGAVPVTSVSVQSALTAQGLTTGRAVALDTTGSNAATAATQATSAAATSTAIKAKTDLLPASPASTSDVQPTVVVQGD